MIVGVSFLMLVPFGIIFASSQRNQNKNGNQSHAVTLNRVTLDVNRKSLPFSGRLQ
jgi:hypothetical protein